MGLKVIMAIGAVVGTSILALGLSIPGAPAHAQASLAPDDCVCSTGQVLDTATGSRLLNCQCGAMQCVVVTGSGQLQCR